MASPRHSAARRVPDGLERLKERIRALEGTPSGFADGEFGGKSFSTGAVAIDRHLPWDGLPAGALHEVTGADGAATTAFCAALVGRLAAADRGAVLWCEGRHALDAGGIYGPGLAAFGLAPGRLILVRARRDEDVLWAMEEGLRCPALAAVVGEAGRVSLTAGRRLQLAAAESGVTAFLLRPAREATATSAAMTWWRVTPAAGETRDEPGLGPLRWQAELFRCRGGSARSWIMEWDDETGGFAVAAPVRDGPAVPRDARMAG